MHARLSYIFTVFIYKICSDPKQCICSPDIMIDWLRHLNLRFLKMNICEYQRLLDTGFIFDCIFNSFTFNVVVKIVTSLNQHITFLLKCIFCTFALSGHFLCNIFYFFINFPTAFIYLSFVASSKT